MRQCLFRNLEYRCGWNPLSVTKVVSVEVFTDTETSYPAVPDSSNHEVDTLSTNPRLYAIPDAGHSSTVEYGPERSPDTERGPGNDWETNVVCRTDATSRADEAGGNRVSDPDT